MPKLAAPLPAAPPATNLSKPSEAPVPHPPGGTSATVEEIFLSPRVVDKRAFADFSEALRSLIEQAAIAFDQLKTSADDATRLRDDARDAAQATQLKLDLAAKALGAVDQRAQHAATLLENAAATAARLDSARSDTARILDEHFAKLDARVRDLEETATERLARFNDAVDTALARADERIDTLAAAVNATLTPAMQALGHMCDRAESLLRAGEVGGDPNSPSLADLVQRAQLAGEQAAFAARQLDSVRAQADEATRLLGESLTSSAPLIDELRSAPQALKGAAAQSAIEAEQHRAAIKQSAGDLAGVVTAAQRDIATAVETADEARRSALQTTAAAENVAARLDDLLTQVKPWRDVLLQPPGAPGQPGGALPEPLQRIIDSVRADLRRDLSALSTALHAMADRTDKALGA